MATGTGNAYSQTNNPAFLLSPATINDLRDYIAQAVQDRSFPWDCATHTYTNINGIWTLVGYVYYTGKYASFIATSYLKEAVIITENNGTWSVDTLTMSWVQIGVMTGGNTTTLTNVPASVHEYLIAWKMNNGFAWKTIVFSANTTNVNDSFYYSPQYYESVIFIVENGTFSIQSSWTTGKYNTATLGPTNVEAYLYAR